MTSYRTARRLAAAIRRAERTRYGSHAAAALLGLAAEPACVPHYSNLEPLHPAELWAPLPIQHVEIDGIDIAYVDSGPVPGDEGPPVVLVHGLSSWIGFWEHQIPHLAARHRVLALDLPGYGASARPDAPYTVPWFAGVLDRWLDALGVEQAVVVGHSMGGQIAMTLTLEHPERVRALVLSAPAGIETFQPGHAAWLEQWYTERRTYDTPEEDIRHAFSLTFARRDEGYERLLSERVRMRETPELMGTSVAVSRSIAGMLRYPVFDRLSQIAVPTLVVFGTDDQMIPNPVLNGGRTEHVARTAQRAIAGSRMVLVQRAGHTVHHDAPEVFNREVDAFLATAIPGSAP